MKRMQDSNLWLIAVTAIFIGLRPAAASIVAPVIFSDKAYSDANWAIPDSLFMDASVTGQQASGGNPGSFRQIGLIFAERPDYAANLNGTFVYTPATQGAITAIDYNFDLKTINAFGASYCPLIKQGGELFYDSLSCATTTENIWTNYDRALELDQFTPLHGGPDKPDFDNGSTITFGYLATTGGAGFYESITGIDNDPITLTVSTSTVPEPSLWLPLIAVAFWMIRSHFLAAMVDHGAPASTRIRATGSDLRSRRQGD